LEWTRLCLDETLKRNLSIDICAYVLEWSGKFGLKQSEAAAQRMATKKFEQLAKTEGFMRMDAETLERLLDDDRLSAKNEEAVWEAVAVWRGPEKKEGRGFTGLVEGIRFLLMEEAYLRDRAAGMAPVEDAERMEGIVADCGAAREGCPRHRRRLPLPMQAARAEGAG